jgi:hypothetical protein
MRSVFSAYLQLGFEHIADLGGYDHILFIIALCAVYRPGQWRRVALLVTAFTVGHSLTLALAALDIIPINAPLIEFLIPVTILLTALYNVFGENKGSKTFGLSLNYLLALFFGLIHGMGFSNFFRSTAMPGEEGQFLSQLLAFNLGVELGQLGIVAVIMIVALVALLGFRVRQHDWNLFISGGAAGLSLVMALERLPL